MASTTAPPAWGEEPPPAVQLRHALRLLESAQRQLRASIAADVDVGLSELTALEFVGELPGLNIERFA